MPAIDDEPVLYCAVLRPHRSASKVTVRRLIIGIGVVWGIVGLLFASFGAWPVMPFLGLEILILIAAFTLYNSSSRTEESINLTATTLTVRRIDPWGKRTVKRFPTNWLQINFDDPPTPRSRIELRSRGGSVHIGGFLGPAEKLDLARTLKRHLGRQPPARSTHPLP